MPEGRAVLSLPTRPPPVRSLVKHSLAFVPGELR